jgi:hypothetical protein
MLHLLFSVLCELLALIAWKFSIPIDVASKQFLRASYAGVATLNFLCLGVKAAWQRFVLTVEADFDVRIFCLEDTCLSLLNACIT